VPWAFKEMAATRVQAHEVAAVLQWHIRNDFISRGALLLVGMVAAAALVARGAARGGAAGRAHLAAGALVLAAGGLCIARCPPGCLAVLIQTLCMADRRLHWHCQAPGPLCRGVLARPALACRPCPAQAHWSSP
jgi:hypothetical protein